MDEQLRGLTMKAIECRSNAAKRHYATAAKLRRRGTQALERLIDVGLDEVTPIGQTVSLFLLSMQKSAEFWCDLSLLRSLSIQHQDDCMAVLALYLLGDRPLSDYLTSGEETFASLIERWWITVEPSETRIVPSF
jgi:hypothetical protein